MYTYQLGGFIVILCTLVSEEAIECGSHVRYEIAASNKSKKDDVDTSE